MTGPVTERTRPPREQVRAAGQAALARVERAAVPDQPTDRRTDLPRPGGPGSLAAVRGFLGRGGNPTEFFVDLAHRWPDLAHFRLGREHVYVLNDPSFVVDVMLTRGRDTMKGRGLQAAKALLGAGLLTSEGDLHLRQRRLVQPAFHRDRIARYAGTMTRRTLQHERTWADGLEVDLVADMSALTLAVVGDTLFGADLTGDAAEVGAALTEVLEGFGSRLFLGQALMRVPSRARRRALAATGRLDALVQRIIDEHRASGDTGDMLSMLIAAQEDGVAMDDDQLRDEAMTLVLAGHETTAMALSWTWLLLARNPAEGRWLRAELDEVLGGRAPTMADLPSLPRTRATVAESMRLYPPAWIMGRRALVDLDVGGWTVPAGALVLASQFALHRDPRFWDSALSFRPQRWLTGQGAFDEQAPGQPRGAWFPFGWGNRRCIGDQFAWTEATLVLATLAQRWAPALVPGQEVRPEPAVTLRPGGGVRVVLRLRPRGSAIRPTDPGPWPATRAAS